MQFPSIFVVPPWAKWKEKENFLFFLFFFFLHYLNEIMDNFTGQNQRWELIIKMKIKIEYTMRILKNIKTLNDVFGKRRREGKIYGQYAILYRGSKRKEGSALKKSRSTIRNVRRRARGRLCCVPCIPFTVAFVYFYARMRNTLRYNRGRK